MVEKYQIAATKVVCDSEFIGWEVSNFRCPNGKAPFEKNSSNVKILLSNASFKETQEWHKKHHTRQFVKEGFGVSSWD